MRIVIMLPYDGGAGLIKKHPLIKLSQGVQDWYGTPCFKVTVESEADLEEVVKALRSELNEIKRQISEIRRAFEKLIK
ncbi:MAG: DUF5320 domain-containing protein [Candidatus Bathyarchaeia archaeon]